MTGTGIEGTVSEILSKVEEVAQPAVLKEMAREVADSLEIPSRPLFGVLPLQRVIPQDVHSMADYANGLICASTIFSDCAAARVAGAALAGSIISTSLLTDYRLSAANVIPVEVHEATDYLWGASAIAAPFVFGYYKRSPVAAACHVAVGAFTILASLFTDYRAAKGAGRSKVESAGLMSARIQPGVSAHVDYTKVSSV